jgi:hypothetical protein
LAAVCVVCFACSPADQALVLTAENAIAVETRTAIILRDMKNPPGAKPNRNNTNLNRQLCVMVRACCADAWQQAENASACSLLTIA